MKNFIFYLGDRLYRAFPAVYVPLYSAYKRYSDVAAIQLIGANVRPGAKVIDIGANIGFYSRLLYEMVGSAGHVFAFEPEPRNYTMLRKRVTGLSNVTTINGAIGRQSGLAKLFISPDLNVDHHTYDDGTGRAVTDIRTYAIDEYFKDHGPIDFIKMDIQGHEYQALLGAREMLAAATGPKLFMEFWPYGISRAGDDPRELLQLLADCGYGMQIVATGALEDIDAVVDDPSYYVNIFASKGGS
ncbi:FkbM family methyltransferase [Roseibium sediminis]|uniref:FkbM family methyltransferase n=1 Tax=Roseibium sediminis TaxID=1775174 RepID=UPI001375F34B|nr:FkbM family methyltransferase [Roseibium sediminis]